MTPFVCNCINKYRTYLKYDESINTSIFVEAGQLCSVESTTVCRSVGKAWLLYLFFAKSPSQVMPGRKKTCWERRCLKKPFSSPPPLHDVIKGRKGLELFEHLLSVVPARIPVFGLPCPVVFVLGRRNPGVVAIGRSTTRKKTRLCWKRPIKILFSSFAGKNEWRTL